MIIAIIMIKISIEGYVIDNNYNNDNNNNDNCNNNDNNIN